MVKIICILDYFLPGFKGGGPIRTLANMRLLLAGKVEISIFTRDRDLGSDNVYPSIASDTWNESELGEIYYASPSEFGFSGLLRALKNKQSSFDFVYLNSFFGYKSSILPLLWFRKHFREKPILLAPRGEFSAGALSIKFFKKKSYIYIARFMGLYDDVLWHASTETERKDILRQFPIAGGKIYVAEDPVAIDDTSTLPDNYTATPSSELRSVFVSRISPMKNLDGLIRMLFHVKSQVFLDVYGPIEDVSYWQECCRLMRKLPPNVIISYKGEVAPELVSLTFSAYDIFIFPTQGENFGHVIFEALSSGTPVLLSDQTSWQPDPDGAVSVIPLNQVEAWADAIESAAERDVVEKMALSKLARAYAQEFLANSEILEKNFSMFESMASIAKDNRSGAKNASL